MARIGHLDRHGGDGAWPVTHTAANQRFISRPHGAMSPKIRRRTRGSRSCPQRLQFLGKVYAIFTALIAILLSAGDATASSPSSTVLRRQKPCAGVEPCSCDMLASRDPLMVPRTLRHRVNDVVTSAALVMRPTAFSQNNRLLFLGDNVFLVDSVAGYPAYSAVYKVALNGYSTLNFISHNQQLREKYNWAFETSTRSGLKYRYLTDGTESDVKERVSVQAWSNAMHLSGDAATLVWIDTPTWGFNSGSPTDTASSAGGSTTTHKSTDVFMYDIATEAVSVIPESASYIHNGRGTQGTVRLDPQAAGKFVVYHEFDYELQRSSVILYNKISQVSMPLQYQDGSSEDHSFFAAQIVELSASHWSPSLSYAEDVGHPIWVMWLDTSLNVGLLEPERQIVVLGIDDIANSSASRQVRGIHQTQVTLEFLEVASGDQQSFTNFNSPSSSASVSSTGLPFEYLHNYMLTDRFVFVLMCTTEALEVTTECVVRHRQVGAIEHSLNDTMDEHMTDAVSFIDIESTRNKAAPLSLHQARGGVLLYLEHTIIARQNDSTPITNATVLHTVTLSSSVPSSDPRFESACAMIQPSQSESESKTAATSEEVVSAAIQYDSVLWVTADGRIHITDLDKDNDGVNDVIDAFPMYGEFTWDSDNDGVADEVDMIDASNEACARDEIPEACASDFDQLMIMWVTIAIVLATHKLTIHRHYHACYNSILESLEAAAYAGMVGNEDQNGPLSPHSEQGFASFGLDSTADSQSDFGSEMTSNGFEAPQQVHRHRIFARLRNKVPEYKFTARALVRRLSHAMPQFGMESIKIGGNNSGSRLDDWHASANRTKGRGTGGGGGELSSLASSGAYLPTNMSTSTSTRRSNNDNQPPLWSWCSTRWLNDSPQLKKRYSIHLKEVDLNNKCMHELKELLGGITGEEDVESLKPIVQQKLDELTKITMVERFPNVAHVSWCTHVVEQLIAVAALFTASDLVFYGGRISAKVIMLSAWVDFTIMPVLWLDLLSKFMARRSIGEFLETNWASLLALWTDVPYFALASSMWYELQAMMRFTKLFRVARIYHMAAHKDAFVTLMVSRPEHFLGAFLVLFLLIAALCMRIFEFEYTSDGDFNDIINSIWFSFVTVTTVGYGGYVPSTQLGRIMAFVLMIVGIGLTGTLSSGVAKAIQTVGSTGNKVKQLKVNNKARAEQYFGVLQESTVAYNPILNVMSPIFHVEVITPNSGFLGLVSGVTSIRTSSTSRMMFKRTRRNRGSTSSIGTFDGEPGTRQFKLSLEVALKLCTDKVWTEGTSTAHASARVAQSKKVSAGLKLEDILLDRSAEYSPRVRLELLLKSFHVHNIAGKQFGELVVRLNKVIFAPPKQHDLYLERAFSIVAHSKARAEAREKERLKTRQKAQMSFTNLFENSDDEDDDEEESNERVYQMQDPIDAKLVAVESVLRESQFNLHKNVNFHLINTEVALLVLQYDRLLSAKWLLANVELKLERAQDLPKPEMVSKAVSHTIKSIIAKMPHEIKQQGICEFLGMDFTQGGNRNGSRFGSSTNHKGFQLSRSKIRNAAAKIIRKNKATESNRASGYRMRNSRSSTTARHAQQAKEDTSGSSQGGGGGGGGAPPSVSAGSNGRRVSKRRGSSLGVRLSDAGKRASEALGLTSSSHPRASNNKVAPELGSSEVGEDFTSLLEEIEKDYAGGDGDDDGEGAEVPPSQAERAVDKAVEKLKASTTKPSTTKPSMNKAGTKELDLEDLFDDIVRRSSYLQTDGQDAADAAKDATTEPSS